VDATSSDATSSWLLIAAATVGMALIALSYALAGARFSPLLAALANGRYGRYGGGAAHTRVARKDVSELLPITSDALSRDVSASPEYTREEARN